MDNFWQTKEGLYLSLLIKILVNTIYYEDQNRYDGKIWPENAHTMIGIPRLQNIVALAIDVIKNKVPGDFVETGVWRGGATILMRAILKVFNISNRNVWLCDSFAGLPRNTWPQDAGLELYQHNILSVALEQVKENFNAYDLLDEQVKFLKGFFKETLPTAPINTISILRLDGDLYESTWQALIYLYPKIVKNGYIIIDDYGCIPACQQAVIHFREKYKINDPIHTIDWAGVFWKKS
jgi:hypothetical protein